MWYRALRRLSSRLALDTTKQNPHTDSNINFTVRPSKATCTFLRDACHTYVVEIHKSNSTNSNSAYCCGRKHPKTGLQTGRGEGTQVYTSTSLYFCKSTQVQNVRIKGTIRSAKDCKTHSTQTQRGVCGCVYAHA